MVPTQRALEHHLFRRRHESFRAMWLVSTHSNVTLAPEGTTKVRLEPPVDGPTCGVIPIGVPPSAISTRGLRWDLGPGLTLAYGQCVSSSNHAEDGEVTITTDRPVLFTASVDAVAALEAATKHAP